MKKLGVFSFITTIVLLLSFGMCFAEETNDISGFSAFTDFLNFFNQLEAGVYETLMSSILLPLAVFGILAFSFSKMASNDAKGKEKAALIVGGVGCFLTSLAAAAGYFFNSAVPYVIDYPFALVGVLMVLISQLIFRSKKNSLLITSSITIGLGLLFILTLIVFFANGYITLDQDEYRGYNVTFLIVRFGMVAMNVCGFIFYKGEKNRIEALYQAEQEKIKEEALKQENDLNEESNSIDINENIDTIDSKEANKEDITKESNKE